MIKMKQMSPNQAKIQYAETVKEIKSIYLQLDKLIRAESFDDINHLLIGSQSLNVKAAMLRYTYCVKDKISKWSEALESAKETLGKNSSEILIGLDND